MTETMVERVARVIHKEAPLAACYDWSAVLSAARAVIEATRVPTDTMLDRGYEQSGPIDGAVAYAVVGEIWDAMVDGALTEEAKSSPLSTEATEV